MPDITSFPSRDQILVTDPKVAKFITMTATDDLKAGEVVQVDGDETIGHGKSGDDKPIIGVNLYDVSSGNIATVCGPGSICYVANADDTTAVSVGSTLEVANLTKMGAVKAYGLTADAVLVGVAIEAIAADGWGKAIIMPYRNLGT